MSVFLFKTNGKQRTNGSLAHLRLFVLSKPIVTVLKNEMGMVAGTV